MPKRKAPEPEPTPEVVEPKPLAHPQELNADKRLLENVPITQGTRKDLGDGFVMISY